MLTLGPNLELAKKAFRSLWLNECQASHDLAEDRFEQIVSWSESHLIDSVLCHYLNCHSNLSVVQREFVSKRLFYHTARAMQQRQALSSISQILGSAKVRFLLLRGQGFTQRYFPAGVNRTSGDIDLVVKPEDISSACQYLCQAGFELQESLSPAQRWWELKTQHAFEMWSEELGASIDLHWRTIQKQFGRGIPVKELFEKSIALEIDDTSVLTPSIEDDLLLLVEQGGKHAWSRIQTVMNIAAVLVSRPDLLTSSLQVRASERGLERLLETGVALSSRIFGVPVDLHSNSAIVDELLAGLESKARALDEFGSLSLDLAMRSSLVEKMKYIAGRLIVPHGDDWKDLPLPDPLFPLYFLYKPAKTGSRAIRRALTGLFPLKR